MAVTILADSACDLQREEAAAFGVTVLPLKVLFGTEEYRDGQTLTHRRFYEMLAECDTLPTTCQIVPTEFQDTLTEALKNEDDTAVVITLSGKLSGTYQSACMAAEEWDGRVHVLDSENVAVGERLLVLRAAALRDAGCTAEEIAVCLDREKKQVRLMALLDTLEYLKKGGRISSAVAFAGALLSIKPVVAVKDGEVSLIGKARGSKQGNNLLRELVKNGRGIDFSRPLCLGYSGRSDELLRLYVRDSAELWEGYVEQLPVASIGCAIGTHVGPGAVAVAYFEKEE
ncbi:MAG: DegV family protein [Clostridia bacterium]|nr:DegV family protein [Clostridia bacterium]